MKSKLSVNLISKFLFWGNGDDCSENFLNNFLGNLLSVIISLHRAERGVGRVKRSSPCGTA